MKMALTLDNIVSDVSEVVNVLAPMIETADPEIGAAVALGSKIISGVIAAEPTAVALYNSIMGDGTPPTAAQLQAYAANYETAYQQLNTDINAKLAALPKA